MFMPFMLLRRSLEFTFGQYFNSYTELDVLYMYVIFHTVTQVIFVWQCSIYTRALLYLRVIKGLQLNPAVRTHLSIFTAMQNK
jgi:hypothetical protein